MRSPLPDDCPPPPALRFTPHAWAKWHWFAHRGPTEIGAFGLTDPGDLLLVTDLLLPRQETGVASVVFLDDAVAELFDQQVDQGHPPARFARVWLHTHPGTSPHPSAVDEATFARVFGCCHYAIMAILARGGRSHARLRFNLGPGGDLPLPVMVDYQADFPASDHAAWAQTYDQVIQVRPEPLWPAHGGLVDDDLLALADPGPPEERHPNRYHLAEEFP
jgi:hypothetical protein